MARHTVDSYIPFFGRDFYASTAMWTAEEVGHYIRLLVIQWDSGGLPSELNRLEFISPGLGRVWEMLCEKFPVCEDGLRRNLRMEQHRAKAFELKELRVNAGREGGSKTQANRKQTGKQNSSKPQANGVANGVAKVKPPSPSPSPSPAPPPTTEHTHTSRLRRRVSSARMGCGRMGHVCRGMEPHGPCCPLGCPYGTDCLG